jgi:hypothetical protein
MDGGSEGQAGWNERRQGQSRRHETHCGRLTEEHDGAARSVQQRRAGSRFRYRRRRQAAPYLRLAQDALFHVIFFAALWTTLVGASVSATIGNIALGTDTESDRISVRTAVEADSPGSRFPSEHETSIYLSHSATLLDLITANSSSRRAYATLCYSRQRPTSAHANLLPQQTCFDSCIYTPSLPATRSSLPTAFQLQSAPPITCNRSPARPDRTTSSRLPVRLRPAVPPACRPNYPGCLAWTRPLPGCSARRTPITSSRPHTRLHRTDSSSFPASPRPAASPACRPICPGRPAGTRPPLSRSAQRLRASKPCHPVPDGTPCTFQKYDRKKNEKKMPNNSCNNVLQEPGRGIRARHTWHQLWPRANPVYVFPVPQPLALHNHLSLRAGTSTASTRPLTPAHTLPHGRLQRTEGPSSMDHDLRDQSLTPPLLPVAQAATSLATPGRQPTWDSPATLLADLGGAWLGAQRQHDRHGTPSAPTVQFMGTLASAVSQTPGLGSGGGDDGDVRTHNFFSAISLSSPAGEQHMDTLVLEAYQTPGLGSGGGDAGPSRTHSALQPPGTRRSLQPSRRDSISAAGLYSSAREQCMDTPTLAADQTPGLGSGGGATDNAGTHFVLQPPRDRCSSRQSLQHSISAVSLSFRARGRYIDSPTLAADQTPGLGSGGGDTRPVRVHLALQPPGTRVTLTRSISTPATPSSDPALTAAHSRILGSSLQQTLHWVATETSRRNSNAGYCGVGSYFLPNDIAAACRLRKSVEEYGHYRHTEEQKPSRLEFGHYRHTAKQRPSRSEAQSLLDAHIAALGAIDPPTPVTSTATTVEPTPTSCSTLSATAPGHARPPDVSHA